jgi:EAL domain-containing protein (putative c-di-GMP-specific phosphodiesterase class I)
VQQLGIEPIVGFIESANTMALLWQMDASLIQGYYIAAPTPDMSYDFSDF